MRTSNFAKQIQRFAISGLLATGLHVVIAFLLIRYFAVSAPYANGMAFVMATVFSYTINTRWSFSSPIQGKNLLRFVCVSLMGFALAMGVSYLAEQFGLHYLAGIGLVVSVIAPVTFLLHRFWTYR